MSVHRTPTTASADELYDTLQRVIDESRALAAEATELRREAESLRAELAALRATPQGIGARVGARLRRARGPHA